MIGRLRLKLVDLLWPSNVMATAGACANRRWRRGMAGPIEITVTYRDTRQPDGHSREELVEMLATIRKCEAEMGWRVPEPSGMRHLPDAPASLVEAAHQLLATTYPAYCRARPKDAVSVRPWNEMVDSMDTLRRALPAMARPLPVVDGKACSVCGLPFEPGEKREIGADGSLSHGIEQPDSMRRCRMELRRRLDAAVGGR